MSDLVGNQEDWFSRAMAQVEQELSVSNSRPYKVSNVNHFYAVQSKGVLYKLNVVLNVVLTELIH